MTRGALVLGALLATGVAGAAVAQSVTGPAVDPKLPARAVETGPWSADATVARLVYDPIKILGLRSFTPAGRIELEVPMDRAEAGVRDVVAELSSGRLDETGARIELAHVLRDYRAEIRRLRLAR